MKHIIIAILASLFFTGCLDTYDIPLCSDGNRIPVFNVGAEYRTMEKSEMIPYKVNSAKNGKLTINADYGFKTRSENRPFGLDTCEINGKNYAEIFFPEEKSYGLFRLEIGDWSDYQIGDFSIQRKALSLSAVNFDEEKLRVVGISYVKTFRDGFLNFKISNAKNPRALADALSEPDHSSINIYEVIEK